MRFIPFYIFISKSGVAKCDEADRILPFFPPSLLLYLLIQQAWDLDFSVVVTLSFS